jgi:hypothetical protein
MATSFDSNEKVRKLNEMHSTNVVVLGSIIDNPIKI